MKRKKINGITDKIIEIKITNNSGSVYFITTTKYQLSNIIKNTNLRSINKNNHITILNELNYLNSNLDISQLEVINKTDISATIKEKNDSNIYIGEKKIYYTIDNEQNKIINLYELIKKGIFFYFKLL